MPSTSGFIAAIETSAAPISLPTSMRPVVSIVTWTCSGTSRPAAAIARRQPIIAALTCSRSMHVSMRNRSTPPEEQPAGLLLVGVAQLGEADVAEARQLGAGADRAGDVAGPAVGGVVVGDLAGDAGGGDVELVGLVGDAVLVEDRGEAAEAGRLDGVDTDVEERGVHAGDDIGPGGAEHLVAAFERRPAEVVGTQVDALDVGAEGAVEHDDPPLDRLEVGLACHEGPRLPAPPGPGPEGCGHAVVRGPPTRGVPGRASATDRYGPRRWCASYTKAGDDGTTGLFYGGRVRKDSELPRRTAASTRPRRSSAWPGPTPGPSSTRCSSPCCATSGC